MMDKILLGFLLVFIFSCDRNLGCDSFKEGKYILKSDSLSENNYFQIIRTNKEQIEIDQADKKKYMSIEWISDCVYELRSNPNRDNNFKSLTDSSVLRVEIYKTVADTAFYKSYLQTDRGLIPTTSGRMIKVKRFYPPPSL